MHVFACGVSSSCLAHGDHNLVSQACQLLSALATSGRQGIENGPARLFGRQQQT